MPVVSDTTATVKTEVELVSANIANSARNDLKKQVSADNNSQELSKSKTEEASIQPALSEKESKSPTEKIASEIKKDATPLKKEATPEKQKSVEKIAGSEEPELSDEQIGKHPKSRDPSPAKGEPSPAKQESSPTKTDASPPKRDQSPSKRDSSPPKSGKARPKSGKKIEKQTSGSKTSEADTDNPPAPAGEQDIDQTGTNSNEKNKEVSEQNSDTRHLSVSSGPIIIIEESPSIMMDEEEEENADGAENKTAAENQPNSDTTKDPASDTDKEQPGIDQKLKEEKPEDVSKKVEFTEVACEKSSTEDSKTLEQETAALVKNAINEAQAHSSQDSTTTPEAIETIQKVDETKPELEDTLVTNSNVTGVETHKNVNDSNGKTDDKMNAAPSSPNKEVEVMEANKAQVTDDEKMCSAKSTTNGVSYVIINDDANKVASNGVKNKKMPPLKRKEKSIEKTDSAEKSDNGNKRASREVNKDDVKRHSKELKSKAEERNGSKARDNKSLSRNRKKSNERSAEMLEKNKSASEEDKNSSKKSSAQASLEEANPEESSEASDRSRAADSGVMMAEHSLSDSPKSKYKSNKGIVKIIPDDSEENKELINGKPSQRVTPTILSRMNARNNRVQIEEDEKKAREIIRKRHEQSVVSVTQAVQVSTRK